MRRLQHKWDRWIHPDSGRSYHLTSKPPKRMVESGMQHSAPIPELMVDDVTDEPLTQVRVLLLVP